MKLMIAAWLTVVGVIFGSFINALVWRLHEQAKLTGKKGKAAVKRRKELSIVTGRSMCSHCGHELGAKDLVPIISWLWLKGKCRYCGAPIPDSPVVEAITGIAFGVSYAAWPYGVHGLGLFQFVLWLVFLVGFMALAIYDLRWFLLPNRITFPLAILAAVQVVVSAVWQHSFSALWMPLAGAAVIFGLFWMLYQVSQGGWIGGGDVKLGITLGLLAGTPLRALMIIFFASLIGTIISVPQLLRGREGLTKRMPFGPSLLLATVIVALWGSSISTWYQSLVIR